MKKISVLLLAMVSTFALAQEPQSYLEQGNTQANEAVAPSGQTQVRGGGAVAFTFSNRAVFINAVTTECDATDFFIEDFEGGPGVITTCGPTINPAGDGCFPPGEITGFTVSALGPGGNEAVYVPSGALGNADPLVGANSFDDYTIITFDPPVYAAGWDNWNNTSNFTDVRIFLQGSPQEDFLLDVGTNTQTFWGFISTVPVERIELEGQALSGELVGQFLYGADCSSLGVGDNLLAQLEVYPNPVSTVLNVHAPAGLEIQKAQLFDVLGKDTGARLVNGQLDVSQLARGVYILNLETSAGTLTQKVVKQ